MCLSSFCGTDMCSADALPCSLPLVLCCYQGTKPTNAHIGLCLCSLFTLPMTLKGIKWLRRQGGQSHDDVVPPLIFD